jgi:hypothetical protein
MSQNPSADLLDGFLPSFKAHKTVRAAELTHIGPPTMGNTLRVVRVRLPDHASDPEFAIPASVFQRECPDLALTRAYLVVYPPVPGGKPDPYISWSPAAEFEAGYSALEGGLTVFAGKPDARQTDEPRLPSDSGLFRKRYRAMTAEEKQQHDHIKDRADALAEAIGALRPDCHARLLGKTGNHTGFTMSRTYDGWNVTLALRHLEDAVYRAVKALTGD